MLPPPEVAQVLVFVLVQVDEVFGERLRAVKVLCRDVRVRWEDVSGVGAAKNHGNDLIVTDK